MGAHQKLKIDIPCLVLVGSRDRFECDFTIKLKPIEGLVED